MAIELGISCSDGRIFTVTMVSRVPFISVASVNKTIGRKAVVHGRVCVSACEYATCASVSASNYWSSTEFDASNAWNQNFNNGNQNNNNKTNNNYARAVRR